MADHLSSLPYSDKHISNTDMNVVRSVFGDAHNATQESILSNRNFKRLLFIGIIFVVINLPLIESFMKSVVPETSDFIFLLIKTIIFIVIIIMGQFFQMA